jgi:hypothetical protein
VHPAGLQFWVHSSPGQLGAVCVLAQDGGNVPADMPWKWRCTSDGRCDAGSAAVLSLRRRERLRGPPVQRGRGRTQTRAASPATVHPHPTSVPEPVFTRRRQLSWATEETADVRSLTALALLVALPCVPAIVSHRIAFRADLSHLDRFSSAALVPLRRT